MEKLSLVFVLLLSLTVASLASFSDDLLARPDFPSVQAGKLIRELNLFPAKDVNVIDANAAVRLGVQGGKRIVEKRFRFPNVAGGYNGVSEEELGHHAGYYKIANSHASRMFYFFFESRNSKKDPVVIWLTGGPGCSSELAMFYENGPFTIAKNMSLVWNEYGWDKGRRQGGSWRVTGPSRLPETTPRGGFNSGEAGICHGQGPSHWLISSRTEKEVGTFARK